MAICENNEKEIIVTEQQKETCAIMVMRTMLEEYADKYDVSFAEAMDRFANSPMYEALFDYDNRLWTEGPDYLLHFYEQCSR